MKRGIGKEENEEEEKIGRKSGREEAGQGAARRWRSAPAGGGGAASGQRRGQLKIAGVPWAKDGSSHSARAPLPSPTAAQGRCKITIRERHGALRLSPSCPFSFLPRTRARPYLLLFSPSARDKSPD